MNQIVEKPKKYSLVERHSFAWIWMGEAEFADPDRIPDFHWMDDPAWAAVESYHHFGANYQLINDNLLDLSHESFVHEDTIGNESAWGVWLVIGCPRWHG